MFNSLNCENCGLEWTRLIACEHTKRLMCNHCHADHSSSKVNHKLNQSADKWEDAKGRIHRMSKGKEWEINNRVLSPDDSKTVINRVTGRESQY